MVDGYYREGNKVFGGSGVGLGREHVVGTFIGYICGLGAIRDFFTSSREL